MTLLTGSDAPFPEHPDRRGLNDEMHARPFLVLGAPVRLSVLAVWFENPPGDADHRHLAALCAAGGLPPPPTGARHVDVDFGRYRLKWERHGEFATVMAIGAGADAVRPFGRTALEELPREWLAGLPGAVVAAAHMTLVPAAAFSPAMLEASGFAESPRIAVVASGGAVSAYTDFRIGPDGGTRWVLVDRAGDPAQLGRTAQRLAEIEAYRMMALQAFPLAQAAGRELDAIERDLGDAVGVLAEGKSDDAALVARLAGQAVRIERLAHRTSFRFGATRAYHELVLRRLRELREERIDGGLSITLFLDRRLGPAMATVASVGRRLSDLAERMTRANALLRARVDLTLEQQNQKLLDELNRRSALQLRLQQTVEGLSVAAITYYAAGLVGYLAKAAKPVAPNLDPDVVVGIAIIPIAVIVWAFVRRLRRHVTAATP